MFQKKATTSYMFSLLFLNFVTGTMLFTPTVSVTFTPRRSAVSRRLERRPILTLRGGSSEESGAAPNALPPNVNPLREDPLSPVESPTVENSVNAAESSPLTGPTATGTSTAPATPNLGPQAPKPGLLRRTLPNFPWHRLPNLLTYLRCIGIPLFVWLFYLPGRHVATAAVFAIASLTDFLDGYLARRWDITSSFGAFLDPVADKLMVSTALVLLSGRFGAAVALPTAVVLGREIAVSALREWMAQRGQRDSVQVGLQGKVKTALTMVALTVFLLVPADKVGKLGGLYDPALWLLWLSAAITVTSGSVYFRAAAPVLLDRSSK